MSTASKAITDQTIRAVAMAAGYADALVTRYTDWHPYRHTGEAETAAEVWYVLSVKRSADSEFEVIGRRRTKGELIGVLENSVC